MEQLKIVYINLEHRKDRREQIEKELINIPKENILLKTSPSEPHSPCVIRTQENILLPSPMEERRSLLEQSSRGNIHRIDAVYYPKNGPLGCCVSHIKAIELAIKNKWDKVLILEDDFVFINKELTNDLLNRFYELKINWNVLMFSSNLIKSEKTEFDFLNKVIEGKTTSGYLLNSNYYHILLQNFKECFDVLNVPIYSKKLKGSCIDMGWRKLQPGSDWYITNPKIGKQNEGFSDIMNQYKKYDC